MVFEEANPFWYDKYTWFQQGAKKSSSNVACGEPLNFTITPYRGKVLDQY